MQGGKAPAGFHTEVEITITLERGTTYAFGWETSHGLPYASHKALGWAREELRKQKTPGRSKIQRVEIMTQYVEGEYSRVD